MAETFFDANDGDKNKAKRGGIKNPTFTATGKNGESHRANKVKKARQAAANRQARASLYQQRGSMGAALWHSQLEAISKGTA